jgi:hypothetical protein
VLNFPYDQYNRYKSGLRLVARSYATIFYAAKNSMHCSNEASHKIKATVRKVGTIMTILYVTTLLIYPTKESGYWNMAVIITQAKFYRR